MCAVTMLFSVSTVLGILTQFPEVSFQYHIARVFIKADSCDLLVGVVYGDGDSLNCSGVIYYDGNVSS